MFLKTFLTLIFQILSMINIATSKSWPCGSVITGHGILTSENYPENYPSNANCTWTIQARGEHQVQLKFLDFDVETSADCKFDYLQLFILTYSPRFCGQGVKEALRTDNFGPYDGPFVLKMGSDGNVEGKGFKLEYTVTKNGQIVPNEEIPAEPPTTTAPEVVPEPTTIDTSTFVSCADDPCLNGADCADMSPGEVYCFCPDGFEGGRCEIDLDECESSPCENGGTCIDGANSFECECIDGFAGDFCGIDVDDCAHNVCLNGATCIDGINTFECQCPPGFTSWNCGVDIDECASAPCLNMGVCEERAGYYECICYPGFTGVNCEIPPPTTESPEIPTTLPPIITTPPPDPSPAPIREPIDPTVPPTPPQPDVNPNTVPPPPPPPPPPSTVRPPHHSDNKTSSTGRNPNVGKTYNPNDGKKGKSMGGIIGGAVAAFLLLASLIAAIVYFKYLKQTTITKIQPGVDLLNEAKRVEGNNNNNNITDDEFKKVETDKGIELWT